MNIKNLKKSFLPSILAVTLPFITSTVTAATISYQGDISSGNTVTGTLTEDQGFRAENAGGRDWWTFSGQAGDVIDITVGRLDGDLELAFELFFGTTTADESTFQYPGYSFGGLTYLRARDDSWGPNLPGPDEDPQLLGYKLKFTGTYSVVVLSTANDPGCINTECSYAIALAPSLGTVSSVPVPAAGWLFASGLLGLLITKKNKTATN